MQYPQANHYIPSSKYKTYGLVSKTKTGSAQVRGLFALVQSFLKAKD